MIWFLFAVMSGLGAGFVTWIAGYMIAVSSRGDSVDILLVTFGLACVVGTGVFAFMVMQ